ncbi:hypothetical protein ACH5RR_004340 [Cinchona calisaya]|uniref:Uncharacterized protein n=1 Tax=Cinchona calisaya TaxID=153742 RepID=A0ABD3AY36_9GENT
MDKKVNGNAATAKDGAEFGAGGADTSPAGDGAVGPEGAGLGIGVGVAANPVTLMANFWPNEQCWGKES